MSYNEGGRGLRGGFRVGLCDVLRVQLRGG